MRRAYWLLVGLGLVVAAACTEAQSYVYSARRFNPGKSCLEPYVSIDLVDGEGAGSGCIPRCFRFDKELYTSRVCPPLPDSVEELDQESAECLAANNLDIYDASCTAPDDAGDAGEGDDDDDAAVLDAQTDDG